MLFISISNEKQNRLIEHRSGPFELGRGPGGELPRFVIDDGFVSRDHLRVEELPGERLALHNLSTRNPVLLSDGSEIPAAESREVSLPVSVMVGETSVVIRAQAEAPSAAARGLEPTRTAPVPPAAPPMPEAFAADGYLSIQPVRRPESVKLFPGLGDAPPPETLARWMETVLALQRFDAGPAEFHAQAAHSLIDMIGLDVGLVLLRGDKGWQVAARAARADGDDRPSVGGREFSQTVLAQVLAGKQTFYQDLALMKSQESLMSVDAVVASPIFGLQDEVVGVLYGLRRGHGRIKGVKIRPLEAQLVQLLAAAAGANLARTVATRMRTQFEQFFSPELVRELARDPTLLEGRGQEVTILMSDLRGFSTLSEQLGPQDTCRLVRDVMERQSERIVEHSGVIVSYLGDGILAMWNAPAAQRDHAVRACRAALAMQAELPGLSAAWQAVVGRPLRIGVGLNTGTAQVGNTGSSRKFMYGPLGNTVNLASRVEGATKHLKTPVLITGSTRAQIGDAFAVRRLCQVRVVGIQGAVDLYELHGETASPEWLADRDAYEKALGLYESRQWLKTCQTLLPLLEKAEQIGVYDVPTLKLMNRSWACLEAPPDPFDPVLELSSK